MLRRLLDVSWDPTDGIARAVAAGDKWLPLLLTVVAFVSAGVVWGVRWQAGPSVVAELSAAGELNGLTEAELTDKVATTGRVAIVKGVAGGLLGVPLLTLAAALGLSLVGWLLGRSAPFASYFAVAALATLPLALGQAARAVAALARPLLTEPERATLLPTHAAALFAGGGPVLRRLLAAVDFFQLWGFALLGLGFAPATGLRRRSGLAVALLLFVARIGVGAVGLPGLLGGGRS